MYHEKFTPAVEYGSVHGKEKKGRLTPETVVRDGGDWRRHLPAGSSDSSCVLN